MPPAYVQSLVQETLATGVTGFITATGNNAAGNLLMVVTFMENVTSGQTMSPPVDSFGTRYLPILGPYAGAGGNSRVIAAYYAPNIQQMTGNVVTFRWSGSVNFPALYVLEYSGVNTYDAGSVNAANGTPSATSDSGTFVTNATGVIVAVNVVAGTTASAGTGYTQRVITGGFGSIFEDNVGATPGSNIATANLAGGAQDWIMLAANFFSQPKIDAGEQPGTTSSASTF